MLLKEFHGEEFLVHVSPSEAFPEQEFLAEADAGAEAAAGAEAGADAEASAGAEARAGAEAGAEAAATADMTLPLVCRRGVGRGVAVVLYISTTATYRDSHETVLITCYFEVY
jgi:hypothetical protein